MYFYYYVCIFVIFAAWQPGQPSDSGPGYTWDNTPDSDADEEGPEKEDDGPKQPTAPLEEITGYENVQFGQGKYQIETRLEGYLNLWSGHPDCRYETNMFFTGLC